MTSAYEHYVQEKENTDPGTRLNWCKKKTSVNGY
jgi:hypothetical protein